MQNADFLAYQIQRGREAGEKVAAEFSTLSEKQLNWKPSENSWSIGQCLEHLIIADKKYFHTFKSLVEGHYSMTFWERWSPFSGAFGKFMVQRLQEEVHTKMKTHKRLNPSESTLGIDILERFYEHLDEFMNYLKGMNRVNLDKTIIPSPTIRFINYSLRDAIQFLIQHEHRHINQAIKVKIHHSFPQ